MRSCPTCGGANDDAATRCSSCETTLVAAPAPAAIPAGPAEAPPPPARPSVTASLSREILEVGPGGTAEATLDIANAAGAPDRVTVEVIGDAAPWVGVEPSPLDIAAGASASVRVRIAPPLDAGPAGRRVDVGFVVRSAARPEAAVVELAVVELRAAAEPGATEPPPAPAEIGVAPDRGAGRAAVPAAAGRRSPLSSRTLAVAGIVAVAIVIVAAVTLGGALPAPTATPAAVATPSVTPPASGTPAATPVPVATPTPAPPTPTPGPDAPVAWWQDAWDAAAIRGTPLGAFVAEGTTDDGLPFATFADGAVYQRVTDAFSMSGAIWRAWAERGGGASPAPGLGYPASPVLGPDPGHRRQLFDDGAIYWTEATGAHAVHGDVWSWWRQLVQDRGGDVIAAGDSGLVEPLGYPTGDVRADATGQRIELEAGRIGVRADALRWACSSAVPPATFAACDAVDPRP